ncbi:MAG: hypothetical protein RIT27_301 [Pseudomonadota bacterium]
MKWAMMVIISSIFNNLYAMDSIENPCVGLKGSDNPQCEQKHYYESDQTLNDIYKNVIKNTKIKSFLTSGQRAWIHYRDAHCQAVENSQQKSRATCLMELTDRRIQTLQKIYQAHDINAINESAPDFKTADEQLNENYKQIIGKLAPAQVQQLRETQRAWLAFRDQDCRAQSKLGVQKNACLAIHTQFRSSEIEALYLDGSTNKQLVSKSVEKMVQPPQLIGSWQGIGGEAAVQLNFGTKNGIQFYSSTLEQLPFEAGQWQVENNGELQITNSDGRVLHRYVKFVINDQTLSLHETDGARLDYQRINN